VAPELTPQVVVTVVAILAATVLRLAGAIDSAEAGTLIGSGVAGFGLGSGHERTAAHRREGVA
jgi:class 3 adenylate cyclase